MKLCTQTRQFLRATRLEMRKVRWLTRKEVVKHTVTVSVVVAFGTAFFAGIDALIQQVFGLFR